MTYLKSQCPLCQNPRVSASTLTCKCGATWKTPKEFYHQGFVILNALAMTQLKKKTAEDYLDAIEKLHIAYRYLKNEEET